MFRFGSSQPISGKLDAMLAQQQLTIQELFDVPNIIGDIKQRVGIFTQYCKNHRQFTLKLINYAFNTSQKQIQQNNLSKIVYVASEFLACDEDELSHLFLQDQTLKNSSEISEHIEQNTTDKILDNIVESEQIETSPDQSKQIHTSKFQKFELLKQSLKILDNPIKNQTCLGHIHKLFSSLIRKQSNQMLQFFSCQQHYSNLLIKNLNYDSMANILVQLVITEDKNHQYKFQAFKANLFSQILQKMLENLDNDQFFEGSLIFIEQVLVNTKQSYYEHFQDFKRCADVLVSENILKKFLREAKNNDIKTFKNSISYLQMIIRRINSDSQQFDYYAHSKRKQPSMKFQFSFFYQEINQLIELIKELKKQNHLGLSMYSIFLIDLIKNQQFNTEKVNFNKIFPLLINLIKQQQTNGIVKSNLYLLTRQIIEKATTSQIDNFIKEQGEFLNQNFSTLIQRQQKPQNKNQSICYWKILAVILSKKSELAQQTFLKSNINVERIKNKFATTLSNFQQKNGIASPMTPHSPFKNKAQLDNIFEKATQDNNKKFISSELPSSNNNQESHPVGKNKISVPFLNLQDKKLPISPISIDFENIIIQHEQVQTVAIQSPRRGFNFMSMSPRGQVGVSYFKEGEKNSSRKSSQQQIISNIQPIKEQNKQQLENTQQKNKTQQSQKQKISKQEVAYYTRYPLFI